MGLFNYLIRKKNGRYIPEWAQEVKKGSSALILTPHPLLQIETMNCFRDGGNAVFEFSLRNYGDEITYYGIKLLNNFDLEGNEYDYLFSFGKNKSVNGSMVHYTLPHDIPIKVRFRFLDVERSAPCFAQIKLAGLCLRRRASNGKYNPSGTILFRNIDILEKDISRCSSGE